MIYYAGLSQKVPPMVFWSEAEAVTWWSDHAPTYPPVGSKGVQLVPLLALAESPVTAEFLWRQHRAVLDGRSSVSGAVLPAALAECPVGAQAAHWGMAAAVCLALGMREPPLPPGVSEEDAARVRKSLSICSAD